MGNKTPLVSNDDFSPDSALNLGNLAGCPVNPPLVVFSRISITPGLSECVFTLGLFTLLLKPFETRPQALPLKVTDLFVNDPFHKPLVSFDGTVPVAFLNN
jgi:hypothetical protein